MNTILPLPDRRDEPVWNEPTAREQLQDSIRAIELRDEMIVSSVWWQDTLGGHNPVSQAVDEQMPRLMENLDRAIKGEHYAREALFACLHQIQKAAKFEARAEAEAIVERGE